MGQHNAGAADPYALGIAGDGSDEDFRGGADNRRVCVVFRDPKAVISHRIGSLGQI